MSFGRALRIGFLLLVLGAVALDAWLTHARTTSWTSTLRATVYPIVADGQASTQAYVGALRPEDFAAIEAFLRREAARYGVPIAEPLALRLAPPLTQLPPPPPESRNPLSVAAWSLHLRWWASRREAGQPRPHSQIRLFVLYHDPATTPRVAHSLGMQKGLIGVVHAFASRQMAQENNFVIAHELLHTLGATDKYDATSSLPFFPDGYAEPDRQPRYPQTAAEIMGGRIMLAADRAEIPEGLGQATVGAVTAREIGWAGAGSAK
jgi:hypothetical protein